MITITAMIKPYGYKLLHKRRRNRDNIIGGCVGVMLKVSLASKHISDKPFSSFEHTVKIQLNDKTNLTMITIYRDYNLLTMITIYRDYNLLTMITIYIDYNLLTMITIYRDYILLTMITIYIDYNLLTMITIYRLQFVTPSTFLEEFTVLLEILCISGEMFVLSEDINIHLDSDEPYATRLKDIFTLFNLKQYVTFPTHGLGNTIDVVLTHSDSPLITGLQPNDVKLSDHFLVEFTVGISPIKTEHRTVTYRDTKSLNNFVTCKTR